MTLALTGQGVEKRHAAPLSIGKSRAKRALVYTPSCYCYCNCYCYLLLLRGAYFIIIILFCAFFTLR